MELFRRKTTTEPEKRKAIVSNGKRKTRSKILEVVKRSDQNDGCVKRTRSDQTKIKGSSEKSL
jgi:hypothetical protein